MSGSGDARPHGGVTLFNWIAEEVNKRVQASTASDPRSREGRSLIAHYIVACISAAQYIDSEIVVFLAATAEYPRVTFPGDENKLREARTNVLYRSDNKTTKYSNALLDNFCDLVEILNGNGANLGPCPKGVIKSLLTSRHDLIHPKPRVTACGTELCQEYQRHEDIDIQEAKKLSEQAVSSMHRAAMFIHTALDALKKQDRQQVLDEFLQRKKAKAK